MSPANADPPPREPGSSPGDDDREIAARFAEIVRDLEDLSSPTPEAPTHRPPPGAENDTDPGAAGGKDRPARGADAFPAAPWVRPAGPRDWPTTPEVEELEEAETHFVPPDPPFVLGRDPLLTMAWALVIGVPLVVLVLVVLLRPFPTLVGQIGAGAFLAGLGILLWRMPHHRDEDDEGPGAVV